jgi:phosphate transport system permease protein
VNPAIVAIVLLVLLGLAYQFGWARSRQIATAGAPSAAPPGEKFHSRFHYHGALAALWAIVPAVLVFGLWALFGRTVSTSYITSLLPPDLVAQGGNALVQTIQRVRNLASGYGVVGEIADFERAAADAYAQFELIVTLIVVGAAAGLGILALLYARRRISPRLRARNEVEGAIGLLLLACSAVAILTTFGIVASLLTEALRFFTFVNPIDFFFGTVWNPVFSSTGSGSQGDYGLLPLLSGTLMVSAIAMLVSVPVGLMSAIYLNQYASPRFRSVAKPIIEVLAGIPTIVYGFFALTAVGPFLANAGAAIGLDIRATSAATAGLVMGIMIIPFISSLSDDILNQVPRAMRDGSYGLGATKSETIRKVLLPAALPGIVGAFLLAISRAIGETMIVVLAAGNSPVLRFNPFEPTSTVTVSIVNQLTGDTDFAGPQSLVAFALGLTLFVITLILNVIALYIVRRFREQYE